MAGVIDSLYVNHFVEPVMYEVYVRILEYEQDYSELHVLSEYIMNVYQNKNHNSELSVVKTRAKPFSNAGKKYFKEMRMIGATAFYTDNIFKYKDKVLKKKNLKHFKFEIVYDSTNANNSLILLNCTPNKKKLYYYRISLSIDRSSYAIQKMIIYSSGSKKYFKEIGFKKINNKWYLDYSVDTRFVSSVNQGKSESWARTNRLAIYNISDRVLDDNVYLKTGSNIIVDLLQPYLGDWSDSFWGNYNYVPLPAWIEGKVTNALSQ